MFSINDVQQTNGFSSVRESEDKQSSTGIATTITEEIPHGISLSSKGDFS
jgi:hypothetical protein